MIALKSILTAPTAWAEFCAWLIGPDSFNLPVLHIHDPLPRPWALRGSCCPGTTPVGRRETYFSSR
jgi:hypothetical protein